MYQITSTYAEYAPEFDQYPEGREWPGTYTEDWLAWLAVEAYLLAEHHWHRCTPEDEENRGPMCIAPLGHTAGTFCVGELTVNNDEETITITEIIDETDEDDE